MLPLLNLLLTTQTVPGITQWCADNSAVDNRAAEMQVSRGAPGTGCNTLKGRLLTGKHFLTGILSPHFTPTRHRKGISLTHRLNPTPIGSCSTVTVSGHPALPVPLHNSNWLLNSSLPDYEFNSALVSPLSLGITCTTGACLARDYLMALRREHTIQNCF